MAKVVYKGKEVANNRNNYVDLLGKPTIMANKYSHIILLSH